MKNTMVFALCLLVCAVIAYHQVEAGTGFRLKKLIKYGLIANAFTGKKILFPLPVPLPIPVFQENIHHQPIPINHHTHADIGYGFEHFGGHYGGGQYGGGLGHGIHGGGW